MKMQTFHRHVVFLVHFAQETHSAKYYKVLTTSRCSQNFVIFCTVSFLNKIYKKNSMPLKCLHFHFFGPVYCAWIVFCKNLKTKILGCRCTTLHLRAGVPDPKRALNLLIYSQ